MRRRANKLLHRSLDDDPSPAGAAWSPSIHKGCLLSRRPIDVRSPSGAPNRLRGVTLLTDRAEERADFVARFGYATSERTRLTERMISDTDVIDIREVPGFVPSVPGAGVPDHVAFRAPDADAIRSMRLSLKGHGLSEVHDRKYFLSLYVRDPAGILIEHATDGAWCERRRVTWRAWPNPVLPVACR